MFFTTRKTRSLAFSLMLALTSTALTPLISHAEAIPAVEVSLKVNPPVSFAQRTSDIIPDPSARYGRLSNGMGYVIYKNNTPEGMTSVRLRINAGASMEKDYQRGLAHFLEHMAFNGSKNVPEGEMVKLLERHGLKFGPDTNAYTSWDETVYMLDLPKSNPEMIDTALFIMRETAGNLLLDPKAIDRERGVILGEERARANPQLRAYLSWAKTAFDGQIYPDRYPIGLTEVIRSAPRQAFADFYNDFYRPEYATLIIVGDVNPDEVEAKIKAKFSDWKGAPQSPNALTDYGAYKTKGLNAFTYTEKGLPNSLSISWAAPYDNSVETKQSDYDDTERNLIEEILNLRLERQSKDAKTAFVGAGFRYHTTDNVAQMYALNITAKPGQDKLAFEQALMTLRQLMAYGVTQNELDRVLSELQSSAETSAKSEKKRNTPSIAGSVIDTLGNHDVLTSPSQNLEFFSEIKPKLTLAAINARIKSLNLGDGPLIAHNGEDVSGFDKSAMLDSYKSVMALSVTPLDAQVKKAWPYEHFGTPSKIVSRTVNAALGATQVVFANGVRLNVKTTTFKDDEIRVNVRFAGGLLALSPQSHAPVFAANSVGIFEGGLGKLNAEEIKESLTGKIYALNFGIGEDSTDLSGATTQKDLSTQMQVLMAFTQDSALRPDAFERLKAYLPNFYTSLSSTPNGVFSREAGNIIYSGDERFGIPTQENLANTKSEAIKTLVSTIFSTAPIEITFVGNISEAQAIEQVQKTFATLPLRAKTFTTAPGANAIKFPTKNLQHVLIHNGREDQNLSYIAWPTTDFYSNTQTARGLEILSDVLNLRLTDEIREKQGAAYSPNSSSTSSDTFKGFGYVSVSATVKPEADEAFYQSVTKIINDLREHPITTDELLRARKPVLDRLELNLKTNGFWSGIISGSQSDKRQIQAFLSRKQQLSAITPKDIQTLAQTYLVMGKALRIQVKAQTKPVTTP